MASGEDIFGPLLRKYLLNNNHRVTVELLPDPKLGSEKEEAEKERLKAHQAKLTQDDLEATVTKTKELKERQVPFIEAHTLAATGCLRCRCARPKRQWSLDYFCFL